jgi:hypothetical protein
MSTRGEQKERSTHPAPFVKFTIDTVSMKFAHDARLSRNTLLFRLYDFRRFVRYDRSLRLFRRSYQLRPFYRGPRCVRRLLSPWLFNRRRPIAKSQAKASRGAGVGSGRHA